MPSIRSAGSRVAGGVSAPGVRGLILLRYLGSIQSTMRLIGENTTDVVEFPFQWVP